MSDWRIPGQPFGVTIAGRQVWLKPITVKDRADLAQRVRALDIAANPHILDEFVAQLAPFVERIDGVSGNVGDVLAVQANDVLMKLYGAILSGGTLSETERKNSPLPSDSSSPAVVVGTVVLADPDVVSPSEK